MAEEVEQPQEAPRELKFRNSWRDWAVRVLLFVLFLFFASGKFRSTPGSTWVVLYSRVGLGQWLRYFTGVLEIMGAFLVLISQAVEIGLALLIIVTSGASIIVFAVLRAPVDAFVPFSFTCGMIAFWMHRRRV